MAKANRQGYPARGTPKGPSKGPTAVAKALKRNGASQGGPKKGAPQKGAREKSSVAAAKGKTKDKSKKEKTKEKRQKAPLLKGDLAIPDLEEFEGAHATSETPDAHGPPEGPQPADTGNETQPEGQKDKKHFWRGKDLSLCG